MHPDQTTATSAPGNDLEKAFARLPRPQKALVLNQSFVPTKLSLLQARAGATSAQQTPPRLPVTDAPTSPASHELTPTPLVRTPSASIHEHGMLHNLGRMTTMGRFSQHGVEWTLRAQRGRAGLIMIKKHARSVALKEKRILETLRHRNVARLIHAYWEDDLLCLALEYCRFTLAEIIHVHLRLEEEQIQNIAYSIFNAISYLAARGIAHNMVGAKSIRLTTPDLRFVLADFEHATQEDPYAHSDGDLVDLGLVLLECMDGRLFPDDKRKIDFIKEQRSTNKVFGLTQPERWSGCKNLIDFLDELFNESKAASTKLSKPHRFISSKRADWDCMRPYVELVTLECLTLWSAGESDGFR